LRKYFLGFSIPVPYKFNLPALSDHYLGAHLIRGLST
jgi:hypothetical protein